MKLAYAALLHKFPILQHQISAEDIKAVCKDGLKLSLISPAAKVDLTKLREYVGDDYSKILCLGHPTWQHMNMRRVGFTLAVPTANLSSRIGLDWSYDYAWSLAEILREEDQSAGCEQIFLDVIRRAGSVVTYDPVPAAFLRVRLKSSGRDLFTWPRLVDVETETEFHVDV